MGVRGTSVLAQPRLVAAAVLALGGLGLYVLNYPGSMEYDSFVQLVEARARSYSNWHPPVMSWLLGISDALPGPPEAWFIAFTMTICFGGLAAVLWLARRVSWAAVVCAGAILLLPQMFQHQAVVWKDTLFANSVLACFVCIGLGAKHWPRRRAPWLGAAASFLALGILARQNGVVVLPCAALTVYLLARRFEGRAWQPAGGFLLLTLLIAVGSNGLLQLRSDGYAAKQEQFKILELYDITGMLVRNPDLPLAILDQESPTLGKIIRSEGVVRWSPVKNDTLETPAIMGAMDETPPEVLARQWRALVWRYPLGYLQVRSILFRWVFQPPEVDLCHPIHVGDEGDAADLKELGAKPRLDKRDLILWRICEWFLTTPVYSHGLFSLLAVVLAIPLLRRRSAGDVVMLGLMGSAGVFATTFFIVSIACDYRYLYLIDLSALATLLYVAADWRGLWQQKGGSKAPFDRSVSADYFARPKESDETQP